MGMYILWLLLLLLYGCISCIVSCESERFVGNSMIKQEFKLFIVDLY